MNIKELLPIGSVVLLKGASKKLMVFGIRQLNEEEGGTAKEYDYIGVPYPEGNIGSETQYLFNHEDVDTLTFRGCEDEEHNEFMEVLDNFYKNSEN